MKCKTKILRYHDTAIRVANIRKADHTKHWQGWGENRDTHSLLIWMQQSGHGLLGPEGGTLWRNKEGTSNWSVLMPAVSSQVGPRAWHPRQWARVSWQWLCSPQLASRDWGAAHLPSPPTVVGGPCLLPLLPTSISRLPLHHALSTPYLWKPGQHPNKELLGCVLEKKKKDSQE